MRISRGCYNKYHRCPGMAGGGMKYAKLQRCENGFLNPELYNKRFWKLKFNQCPSCKVIVLPYIVRYLDPSGLKYEIKRFFQRMDWK